MILKLKSFSLLNDFQIECKSDAKSKKIRERLKELSQLLANWRLIGVEWRDKWNAIVFVFNSGLISSVYLNHNNCVTDVYHDRYLQNKLLSEHLVNVLLRDNYILVSYTLSRLTLVSLSAPNDRKSRAKHKLKNSNPVMSCIDLESGVTRRVERNLVANESGDLLIVWWRTGTNCVAPWSAPGRSLRDLANIFVYNFIKSNFALISLACISGHIYEVSADTYPRSMMANLIASVDVIHAMEPKPSGSSATVAKLSQCPQLLRLRDNRSERKPATDILD